MQPRHVRITVLTFMQTQRDSGKVTTTMSQEMTVSTQPQQPSPSALLSSAASNTQHDQHMMASTQPQQPLRTAVVTVTSQIRFKVCYVFVSSSLDLSHEVQPLRSVRYDAVVIMSHYPLDMLCLQCNITPNFEDPSLAQTRYYGNADSHMKY